MGINQAVVQLGPVENTLGTIGLLFAGPNVGNPAVHAVIVDIEGSQHHCSQLLSQCYFAFVQMSDAVLGAAGYICEVLIS